MEIIKNCEKEYIEDVCENCEYYSTECGTHPAGETTSSYEYAYCELDYFNEKEMF